MRPGTQQALASRRPLEQADVLSAAHLLQAKKAADAQKAADDAVAARRLLETEQQSLKVCVQISLLPVQTLLDQFSRSLLLFCIAARACHRRWKGPMTGPIVAA